MKIKCTVEFAAEIYISLVYSEQRLTTIAQSYYTCGDALRSKDTYAIRDQLCVVSGQIANEIRVARASERSVLLSLELGPRSITTPA